MSNLTSGWPFKNWIVQILFIVVGLSLTITVDARIRHMIESVQVPIVFILMQWLTWMGKTRLLLIIAMGLLVWGVWHRQPALKTVGGVGFVALAISNIVGQFLKHLIGRPRPGIMESEIFYFGPSLEEGYDSFPSGHTNSAFVMAVVLSSLYPTWRWLWYGAAVLVAFTRVYLDVHFVSDVVAGAILGIIIAKTVLRLQQRYQSS